VQGMGQGCSQGTELQDDESLAAEPPLSNAWTEQVVWEAAITPDTVIEYLTDVEGNWEYFVAFVQKSSILDWVGDSKGVWGPGELRLQDHGILVFGGDAPDKGPGDIRVVKSLATLKKGHPTQVFIVLGNRDVMKMRFTAELPPGPPLDSGLDNPWLPPWDNNPKKFDDFLQEEKLEKNRVSKLKWLLHCTMGCQWPTFLTRKDELAYLYGKATDEDVLASYLDSVNPRSKDPWMLEFIKLGQIAVVLGDTLFVHGGLQDESIGVVPGQKEVETDVRKWVLKLNEWKERELRDYISEPLFRTAGDHITRGGDQLILYGTPFYGNRTVIYHNPFEDGNPVQRSGKVQAFLRESRISRLLTGHQPHGQTPTVVRHLGTGLLAVTADTSRSDGTASKVFNPSNNRGLAISIVRIQGPYLHVEGELNDGSKHGYTLHVDPEQDKYPDTLVGRQLVDQYWVKTVLTPKPGGKREMVSVALGRGFGVSVSEMRVDRACLKLKKSYGWGRGQLAVMLSDIDHDTMLTGTSFNESCEDADELDHSLLQLIPGKGNPLFDREEFMKASTYIFSFNGVIKTSDLEQRKRIVENINSLISKKKRVVFVTNDSTFSTSQLWERIKSLGIKCTAEMQSPKYKLLARATTSALAEVDLRTSSVVTAAHTSAWFLHNHGVRKPLCVCYGSGLVRELEGAGFTDYLATVDKAGNVKPEFLLPVSKENIEAIIAKAPDIDGVLVGWNHQLSALTIAVAATYLRWNQERGKNIPIVTCSKDIGGVMGYTSDHFEHAPFRNKQVRTIGNGGMAEAICRTAGDSFTAIDCGKPSDIFVTHLRWPLEEGGLGIDFDNTVFVGDSMDTDIVLANKTGMKSLLVLSGLTTMDEWRLRSKDGGPSAPTWVIDSFASVHEEPGVISKIMSKLHHISGGFV